MKFFKTVNRNKELLIMALPVLVYIIVLKYMPMFGATIAFQDFNYADGFFGSKWVGFENFEFLFSSDKAFLITRNTLLYNFVHIGLGTILAVILAMIYDLLGKSKFNRFSQAVLLFPHFISWVVGSYFLSSFLDVEKGIFNQIRLMMGGEAVNWYVEPKYWIFIIPICYFWKSLGYSSIIYYSSIKGFSAEYYEAARIDGATWWQQIWYITVPLLKSIVILMTILNIGGIFYSDFGLFYMLPKNSGPLYNVTSTIDTYVYNGLTQGGNLGMTTATGLYQSIVGFILVITTNAIVRKVDPDSAMF